ncbi:CehA/McbA family metallohydrolase [Nocardioides sp. MAHUQ-72]|uniref:CehA/McbA family metallohydrolase n=1 Tax=unclassified Nocardioides TaxID=2615069 RepID=UPI0036090688
MTGRLDRRALLLGGTGVATTAALTTVAPAMAGESSRTLVFKGRFTDPDGPDWHYVPFRVPEGVRALEVHYDYTPTPAGPTTFNVVDIGIFDASGHGLGDAAGFRGWSGGARRSFRINRHRATPGYLAGPITPGRWAIALGPYQIDFGGTPWKVEVTLHFGKRRPRFVPHPPPTSVAGTGAGWYRGDLHVHTVHSDGSQTPAEALADARAAGLDFIGSSEHNTSSAHARWGKVVDDDFLVICGEEVTTRAGHWIAAGLPAGTWVDWRYRPEDGELPRFTQQVRDAGGIAIAAHPEQLGTGIGWQFGDDFGPMDAVEVWNGPWSGLNAYANEKALSAWHGLLTDGVFKPAVGNSDSHNHGQRIGLAQTVVRADSLSVDALLDGYRGGHAWIAESSDIDLDLTATLGEVTGGCGDHVPSSEGDTVGVRLHVTGLDDGCVATLLGPGTTVHATAPATGGEVLLDASVPGGTSFVRAEVRRGPAMVAMTNPVFLS